MSQSNHPAVGTAVKRTSVLALILLLGAARVRAQDQPDRSRDRGSGLPLSMFATYINPGQLIVYPLFEYYRNNDFEYKPADFGHLGRTDFRGSHRAYESLIFLAYGLSDRAAVEFEASTIRATLRKAAQDNSTLPLRLDQSGVGDIEGQLRWRWNKETDSRPEVFSYFEAVIPHQRSKPLIGTPDWEFKFGTGMIRGLSWGTVTLRAGVAKSGGTVELGEYAIEYLRRLSSRLRVFAAIEGRQDEVEFINEAQVFLRPNILLKLNNSFGLTSKAAGWAPEVGVMFLFR